MSELKQCPFCGKQTSEESFFSTDGYPIGCTCIWDTRAGKEAMDRWQSRPIEDALQSRIEELEGNADKNLILINKALNERNAELLAFVEQLAKNQDWVTSQAHQDIQAEAQRLIKEQE